MPRFTAGEDVVLFLEATMSGATTIRGLVSLLLCLSLFAGIGQLMRGLQLRGQLLIVGSFLSQSSCERLVGPVIVFGLHRGLPFCELGSGLSSRCISSLHPRTGLCSCVSSHCSG